MKNLKVSLSDIIKFKPCHDETILRERIKITDDKIPITDWMDKHRDTQIRSNEWVWLFGRPEFLTEEECDDFFDWCIKEAKKVTTEIVIFSEDYYASETFERRFFLTVRDCAISIYTHSDETKKEVYNRFLDKFKTYF